MEFGHNNDGDIIPIEDILTEQGPELQDCRSFTIKLNYFSIDVINHLKNIREKYPYKFVKMYFNMGERFERLGIHKIMHGFADDNDLFQDIKLTIDMKPNQNIYSICDAFKD